MSIAQDPENRVLGVDSQGMQVRRECWGWGSQGERQVLDGPDSQVRRLYKGKGPHIPLCTLLVARPQLLPLPLPLPLPLAGRDASCVSSVCAGYLSAVCLPLWQVSLKVGTYGPYLEREARGEAKPTRAPVPLVSSVPPLSLRCTAVSRPQRPVQLTRVMHP